ncbi:sialidase family protein [Streptomyces hygroscopicus]|uniref:sialidase family protein n=1 Tax=Streptomyces hygroscopicus TaxID=1912 RepID=UPI003F1CBB10
MRLLASLLALVLFLFMAHPCVGASGREMVVVFKGDQTEVPFEEDNGTITKRKPRAFRVPAFVGGIFNGKEFLVVLCDARYYGFSDWSFIEPAVRTSYGDYNTWSDAEIVVKNTRKNKKTQLWATSQP